ncbi:MAG: SIR2 family protein [Prevotella sp.]|jgi:hypothetical protein|nr:SIR2 family protein [Prevotella sp.]MCH3969445.1 SIR2 family protein [Prevotella sp.]
MMNLQELRYFIQSGHINFLYGAGASQPYLPTLGNIENWLSKLVQDTVTNKMVKKIVEASLYREYCEKVILKNYSFEESDNSYQKTVAAYRKFFQVWNELINKRKSQILDKQVNLFTTNIDLLVEKTLSGSGIELNDGFRGTLNPIFNESNFQISLSKSSLQFNKTSEIPMFNLIKLHGSVNWVEEKEKIKSDTLYLFILNRDLPKINSKYFVDIYDKDPSGRTKEKDYEQIVSEAEKIELPNDHVYDDFFDTYHHILMINPTKEKFKTSVLDYHFYELLRIYSNALEKENSLLFVMASPLPMSISHKLRGGQPIRIQPYKSSYLLILMMRELHLKII